MNDGCPQSHVISRELGGPRLGPKGQSLAQLEQIAVLSESGKGCQIDAVVSPSIDLSLHLYSKLK